MLEMKSILKRYHLSSLILISVTVGSYVGLWLPRKMGINSYEVGWPSVFYRKISEETEIAPMAFIIDLFNIYITCLIVLKLNEYRISKKSDRL